MPIDVTCPNASCARRYSMPDSAGGRSVRCVACGGTFVAATTRESRPARSAPPATPPAAAELTAVGRFVVRKKLGAGAFGTVYRAYDPQLDREVALKVPNPGTLDSPQRVERFLREAKAAARLRHPHIVPVFDAGRHGDHHYIAAAFIDGRPLSDTVGEGGTDFRRAARLVRELADALAYAHAEGVVHRDVKGANCMVDAADRLHLMDFGLAARAEDSGEARLTKDGAVMGTPAYMSPEQARGQRGEARPATDQYAAGVVLYELLTGTVPFKGPVAVVIHNVIHTEPDRPGRFRTGVPRDLETICLKAMSKTPEDRYPGCRELADDLRRWLDGEPIAARRLGPVARAARWVVRRPTRAALVAMAVVAAGLTAFATALDASRREAVAQRESAQAAREAEGTARRQAEAALDGEAAAKRAEVAARQGEEQARRRAEAAAERAAQLEYGRKVGLAYRLRLDGYTDHARELLADCRADLRGPEWGYVSGLCQRGTVELRGGAKLQGAATSADGRRVVTTAAGENGVRVWDGPTGAFLRAVGTAHGTAAMAVSADGSRLVVANADNTARVWDAETGAEVRALRHGARVTGVAISADGRRVATACEDKAARVWDAVTGAELRALRHPEGASAVAMSGDAKRVLTSTTAAARVWDADAGTELCAVARSGGLRSAVLSGNGRRVVTGHDDRAVRVWDAGTGAEVRVLKNPNRVVALAVSADGGRVAVARVGVPTRVWDIDTGTEPRALDLKMGGIALSGDGRWAVTTGNAPVATVWDLDVRAEATELVTGRTLYVEAVSGDGRRAVTGNQSRQFGGLGSFLGQTLRVWDTDTGAELPALRHPDQVHLAVLSADGKRAATKGDDKVVRIWNTDTGTVLHALKHPAGVAGLAFSTDRRRLVTGCQDKVVRVWDADTGTELRALAHPAGLFPVSISDDGTRVAVGCDDKTVRVWDAGTGAELHALKHPEYVRRAAISGDGRRVVSWCGDRTARVWDVGTGAELHALKHPDDLWAAAVSRDGKRVATCTSDSQARIWDAELGVELLALKLPDVPSSWLGFSPDDRRLLALGWVWECHAPAAAGAAEKRTPAAPGGTP